MVLSLHRAEPLPATRADGTRVEIAPDEALDPLALRPGPCRRESKLQGGRGTGLPHSVGVEFTCPIALDHPEHGPLQIWIRHEAWRGYFGGPPDPRIIRRPYALHNPSYLP